MPWWGSDKPKLLETAEFHIIDDLKILNEQLGQGSYGTVYCALYNGKPCVVKEMHPFLSNVHRDGPAPLDMCIKEINTLSSLRHPSIVQFLGVHFKNNSHLPILVMERMWKNLFTVLDDHRNQLPLLVKIHILYDVACGLQYLHGQKNPVIHRDLNANNILLTKNLEAKIADLGQAKALVSIAVAKLSTKPGNTAHMPPEALEHKPTYDAKLDIFSFGCTIIHVITEKFPQPSDRFVQSESGQNSFVKQSEVERRIEFVNQMTSSDYYSFQQIACKCLKDIPTDRPIASDICSELETNLQKIEKESPMLAKQYKENKLHLVRSMQLLENTLKGAEELTKGLWEEKESLKTEMKSLQIELDEQKEVTEQLNSQTDGLKGAVKENQDEISMVNVKLEKLQQEKQNLQIKLENEEATRSEKNNKIARLEDNMQKATDTIGTKTQENEGLITKNSDLTRKLDDLQKKYKVLQSTAKKQQDELSYLRSNQKGKIITNTGSPLHQLLLELQDVNETEHQQLQNQRQSYVDVIGNEKMKVKMLTTELCDIKKKYATQKQQLEEKSNRFSSLEASLNELHETLYSKEEKLKSIEENNLNLHKLLENNNSLQRKFEKDVKDKNESLKRKELELQMQKKEHADEINNLKSQHMRECQGLINDHNMHITQATTQVKFTELSQQEIQCRIGLVKNAEDKLKVSQNELKGSLKIQKDCKRQIKQQEKLIKEKDRYIKQLEKTTSLKPSYLFQFDIQWYAHLSLPVKKIMPSATIVKDRVFVSGGFQQISLQGQDLDSILDILFNENEVLRFHTTKCRCDSIASPVVLGGVASVNGQCVLVSGADSVGNTLTGNVYVLCEEGSDEQWKKFSKPVPTPRILPCVCCYGEKWMIVCGGFACKEGSNSLEAVNVVEILDTTKGEWYTLPETGNPNLSTVLACSIVGDDVYITGDDKVLRSSCNKMVSAAMANSNHIVWIEQSLTAVEVDEGLHPFSVVDVNGQPMIIASISGSEDDVTCVLMKDTTDTWRKMSEAVECQHCSAVVVTPTLELLLFGGSEKVGKDKATEISQCGTLSPNLNVLGKLHTVYHYINDMLYCSALDHPICYISEEYPKAMNTLYVQGTVYDGTCVSLPSVLYR